MRIRGAHLSVCAADRRASTKARAHRAELSALGLLLVGVFFGCSRTDATQGSSSKSRRDSGGADARTHEAGSVDARSPSRPEAGQPSQGSGGAPGTGGGLDGAARDSGAQVQAGASVLEHHRSPTRDGVYIDPTFTKVAAAGAHKDPTFKPEISGHIYAQPLFVDGGATGKDRLFVATESNTVYALDARSGATIWQKSLEAPVPLASLPCGNIDPLGITGTPIIDLARRTIYFDAATLPAGSTAPKQLVYALSIDDGSVRSGWPVDLSAKASFNGLAFNSAVESQRGALGIRDGILYIPFGGHAGDCGPYHGWLAGIPLDDPSAVQSWATAANHGGSWGPSGVASDESGIYITTGNTSTRETTWQGGEAIIRFGAGPTFSGKAADFFAPSNWPYLDMHDRDIGGTGPVLFDLPKSNPSKLAVLLGKNGNAYLVNRENLGGVGTGDGGTGEGVFNLQVAGSVVSAAVVYSTLQATYVAFRVGSPVCPIKMEDDIMAVKIIAGSPPTLSVAWCGALGGRGSPMVTTTDGKTDTIVWSLGAEGSNRLEGFDGDTGKVVFPGTAATDAMTGLRRFMPPIAAKGRIYVAGDDIAYSFIVGG